MSRTGCTPSVARCSPSRKKGIGLAKYLNLEYGTLQGTDPADLATVRSFAARLQSAHDAADNDAAETEVYSVKYRMRALAHEFGLTIPGEG